MNRILRIPATAAVAMAILLAVSVPTAISAESAVIVSSKQLSALVSAVRAETDTSKQEIAAQKIPQLLNGSELGNVDTQTLQALAALLDTSNDAVRRWVALSLSMFDSRAKFAVPKLLAILPSVQCSNLTESNSAETIRFAIQSISGVSPPPTACLRKLQESKGA